MKLYNADCLDIMREMPDKSVDLVITDPPYGIKEDGRVGPRVPGNRPKWQRNRKPKYDQTLGWDNKPATKTHINELRRISKNQIIFGGNYFELPPTSCWLVWDKLNGESDFADCELAWTSFKSAIRMFSYNKFTGLRGGKDCIHPTQKPVKLFEWIIRNYAKEGDVICDPFFGSGSCLVAAVRLGHDIIGVEKEKVYFEAGKARIEKEMKQGKLQTWGLVTA